MKLDIKFKLLVDCPECIPELSQLWFNELGQHWIPNANIECACKTYQEHLNSEDLPLTLVAIHEEKPIAMSSLRKNDGIREDLTPWLGSLIVNPKLRSQGLGERLIKITKHSAKIMGYDTLYLLALDPSIPNWYARLGWKRIGVDKLYHHPVTVMSIPV
jgi:predicted N-acetyltransferase YhbS